MEKAKIRPLATPKPLNRSSQKLAGVITFWTSPGMQNFVSIGWGVSVPKNTWFCRAFGVTSMFGFLGSSIRLQYGYLRKVRQMTSFRVRKCLLGCPDDYILYLYPWISEKPPFRGPILTGLSFFATENRFNMEMIKYKLPLIVMVAA